MVWISDWQGNASDAVLDRHLRTYVRYVEQVFIEPLDLQQASETECECSQPPKEEQGNHPGEDLVRKRPPVQSSSETRAIRSKEELAC